jgi:hypothetical protein
MVQLLMSGGLMGLMTTAAIIAFVWWCLDIVASMWFRGW